MPCIGMQAHPATTRPTWWENGQNCLIMFSTLTQKEEGTPYALLLVYTTNKKPARVGTLAPHICGDMPASSPDTPSHAVVGAPGITTWKPPTFGFLHAKRLHIVNKSSTQLLAAKLQMHGVITSEIPLWTAWTRIFFSETNAAWRSKTKFCTQKQSL